MRIINIKHLLRQLRINTKHMQIKLPIRNIVHHLSFQMYKIITTSRVQTIHVKLMYDQTIRVSIKFRLIRINSSQRRRRRVADRMFRVFFTRNLFNNSVQTVLSLFLQYTIAMYQPITRMEHNTTCKRSRTYMRLRNTNVTLSRRILRYIMMTTKKQITTTSILQVHTRNRLIRRVQKAFTIRRRAAQI